MKREHTPVDVNASQLLAAIVIWLMKENESFHDAANRLGIPAVHVGASKQVLIQNGVAGARTGDNVLIGIYPRMRLIEKEETARSSKAWPFLVSLLGEKGIQTGYVYDLDMFAEWYNAPQLVSVALYPSPEMRKRLREVFIPTLGNDDLFAYQQRLELAKAIAELVLLEINRRLLVVTMSLED